MIDVTAELGFIMQDSGVLGTLGSASTYGTFRKFDEAVLGNDGDHARVYGAEFIWTIKTGSFAGLVMDALIVINGTTYKVRGHSRIDDGELTRIYLGT
jgi:hypothetical protein